MADDYSRTPAIQHLNPYQRIAFSTRNDGNMVTDSGFLATRQKFLDKAGLAGTKLRLIRPSHSPNIETLTESDKKAVRTLYKLPPLIETEQEFYHDGSDGLLTFDPTISVGLLSADCIPLIIWSTESSFHGVVHIGLLGALNNMVRSLPTIYKENGINPASVYYFLGPSISPSDYKVSGATTWNAVRVQALRTIPTIHQFLTTYKDEEFFDVPSMVALQLQQIGASRQNIQFHPANTASPSAPFFSNFIDRPLRKRRRFMSVVGYSVGRDGPAT